MVYGTCKFIQRDGHRTQFNWEVPDKATNRYSLGTEKFLKILKGRRILRNHN